MWAAGAGAGGSVPPRGFWQLSIFKVLEEGDRAGEKAACLSLS